MRLQCTRTKFSSKGKMQSPLETSVQALRDTRPVEEICAWTVATIPFPQKLFMRGSAPERRRSSLSLRGTYAAAAVGTIFGACILFGKIAIGEWLMAAIGIVARGSGSLEG